jgi:hypothetical protein
MRSRWPWLAIKWRAVQASCDGEAELRSRRRWRFRTLKVGASAQDGAAEDVGMGIWALRLGVA